MDVSVSRILRKVGDALCSRRKFTSLDGLGNPTGSRFGFDYSVDSDIPSAEETQIVINVE